MNDPIDMAIEALPPFVRLVRPAADDPAEAFNCWATEPTGCTPADYFQGIDHFNTAAKFANDIGSRGFLSFVVGAIRRQGDIGPMEDGFLNALAIASAVAPAVVLDDEAQANPEFVEGAAFANDLLASHDPAVIRRSIRELFQASGLTAGAALHTYCRAAILGRRH